MPGLGCGDPREIEIVGDASAAKENWHFDGPFRKMTFASRMQHKIYWGPLKRPIEWSLKTVLAPWAYMASVIYHDWFWYPVKAKYMMRQVLDSDWGRLFRNWETLDARRRRLPVCRHGRRGNHALGIQGVHEIDRHPGHVHQGSAGVRQQKAKGGITLISSECGVPECGMHGEFPCHFRSGSRTPHVRTSAPS